MPKLVCALCVGLTVLLMSGCADQYKIAGNSSVASLDGRMLYLKKTDGKKMCAIDSSEVVHGRFNFMGMMDSIMMVELCMDNESVLPLVIENGNLTIKMDNAGQRVSGGPLNDRLYHFLTKKNQLDSRYMELQYEEMRMMMMGCSPTYIQAQLAPKAAKIAKEIEQTETSFIMANYDNVLGPGVFILLCNQYSSPVLTDQMKYILKKAPEAFLNHPYIHDYVRTARKNMQRIHYSAPH